MAQLYVCAGANREKVDELRAGRYWLYSKNWKDVKTGQYLEWQGLWEPIQFSLKYPNPKVYESYQAGKWSRHRKDDGCVEPYAWRDPTWIVEQSKELRQILVHGQGEFHLRTLKWRLENNEKLQIQFYEPKIPYRETITKSARADYRHKKQSGGAGQFGEVHLIVEPYYEGMPAPEVYKFNGQEYKMTWGYGSNRHWDGW